MKFYLIINFPALDRLVDYLEGLHQREIDMLASQVRALTERLGKSLSALALAITNEQQIEKEN